jgi:hypothetical protein
MVEFKLTIFEFGLFWTVRFVFGLAVVLVLLLLLELYAIGEKEYEAADEGEIED